MPAHSLMQVTQTLILTLREALLTCVAAIRTLEPPAADHVNHKCTSVQSLRFTQMLRRAPTASLSCRVSAALLLILVDIILLFIHPHCRFSAHAGACSNHAQDIFFVFLSFHLLYVILAFFIDFWWTTACIENSSRHNTCFD